MIVGVGCDIVNIERINKDLNSLAKRILTIKEYQIFKQFNNQKRQVEYVAGRFAAKEAIIKAINKQITMHEIEILNNEQGQPICQLPPYQVHLSISHEQDNAIAFVLLEQ